MKHKDEIMKKVSFNADETLCYIQAYQAAEEDTGKSHNNTLSMI